MFGLPCVHCGAKDQDCDCDRNSLTHTVSTTANEDGEPILYCTICNRVESELFQNPCKGRQYNGRTEN